MKLEEKKISFRDLIDLEHKPKKVRYQGIIFIYDDESEYYEYSDYLLSEYVAFSNMKEPNIEIIEEDKPLIEKITNNGLLFTNPEIRLMNKINEVIDYINKKDKGE